MKKLMIAACAIAFAAVVQAAQYSWTAQYIYNGYATGEGAASGTAYLFRDAGTTAYSTILAAVQAGTFSASGYLDSSAIDTDGNVIAKLTADGLDGTTGDNFYIAVLADSGKQGFVGFTYTPSEVKSIGSTALTWDHGDDYGLWTESSSSSNWYKQSTTPPGPGPATPEPTSAMLMLLGVAGLALRRKAK